MKVFAIREKSTGLYRAKTRHWAMGEFPKLYPTPGQARTAVKGQYHSPEWQQRFEIVSFGLTPTGEPALPV